MKNNPQRSPRDAARAERSLYRAVLTMRSEREIQVFFGDLCTPAELQALADRWAVVDLLDRGMPYRQINAETGVSVTTIGRVARFLADGYGGYNLALQRLKKP